MKKGRSLIDYLLGLIFIAVVTLIYLDIMKKIDFMYIAVVFVFVVISKVIENILGLKKELEEKTKEVTNLRAEIKKINKYE